VTKIIWKIERKPVLLRVEFKLASAFLWLKGISEGGGFWVRLYPAFLHLRAVSGQRGHRLCCGAAVIWRACRQQD